MRPIAHFSTCLCVIVARIAYIAAQPTPAPSSQVYVACLFISLPTLSYLHACTCRPFKATNFTQNPSGSFHYTSTYDKTLDIITWVFAFSPPDGVTNLYALEIRDGLAGTDTLAVSLQNFTTPFTNAATFSGNFTSDAINPAVAGSVAELANHQCMGHIYAVAQTQVGGQRAPIQYAGADAGVNVHACFAAVGFTGDMGSGGNSMPPPSPLPSPSSLQTPPPSSGATRCGDGLCTSAVALCFAYLLMQCL